MVDYKANPHSHFPYRADREMKGARALSLEGGGRGERALTKTQQDLQENYAND